MKFFLEIAFGILTFVIILRYVFPRYLRLFNEVTFHRFRITLSKCSESLDEKYHRKSRESVLKISTTKLSVVSPCKTFTRSAFKFLPERDFGRYKKIINHRGNRALEGLENFGKVFDAYTLLRLRLRLRIDRKNWLEVAVKNGGGVTTFQDMDSTDNTSEDTPRGGNRALADVDRSDILEAVECQAEILPETPLLFGQFKKNLTSQSNRDSNSLETPSTLPIFPKEDVEKIDSNAEAKPSIESVPESIKGHRSNEIGLVEAVIPDDDASASSRGRVPQKKEKLRTEDTEKSVQEPGGRETMIKTTEADPALPRGLSIEKFEDAATQTEQMYMIRGVRSCPGSRKHFQKLGAQRGVSAKFRNGGKFLPMEISLPVFLLRKASDNLIYEKGKGSRSPSYIPVPERFRWRYVTPRKIN